MPEKGSFLVHDHRKNRYHQFRMLSTLEFRRIKKKKKKKKQERGQDLEKGVKQAHTNRKGLTGNTKTTK